MSLKGTSDQWVKRSLRSKNDLIVQLSLLTGLLYRVVDLVAVAAAAFVSGVFVSGRLDWLTPLYEYAILLALLLTIIIFERLELYTPWRGRRISDQVGSLWLAWVAVFAILIIGAFLLKVSEEFSRLWVLSWFTLGLVMIFAARAVAMLTLRRLRSLGWNHKKVIIVGTNRLASKIAEHIRTVDWLGFDITGYVNADPDLTNGESPDVPFRGHYDILPTIIAEEKIDEVWICMPLASGGERGIDHIQRVLHSLRHSLVNKRIVPDVVEMHLLERPIVDIAGIPFVNLNSAPHHGLNRVVKTLEDFLLGTAILVFSFPVMAIIALVIKLTSPGPVLFRQERHGWDGRPFELFKFRTMHVHSEGGGTVTQATKGDRRVTSVGRFLRSTSLDELPQLINVVFGQMSIVGPRPHAVSHNEFYKDRIDSYMQRHKVKPGITGWAQVNGWRGETETLEKMRRRVEFDLYYIEHWSLWFDIKIIFLTLIRGFWHKNAY